MSIIRAPRPQSNFYVLDKKISEDKRLSWAARGVLIFLLGKPDHWRVSIQNLINETRGSCAPLGRDGVRRIIADLIDAGYIVRAQGRRDGEFAEVEYMVCEHFQPQTENPAAVDDSPQTDFPAPVQPSPENPQVVNTDKAVSIETAATNEINPLSSKPDGGSLGLFDGDTGEQQEKQEGADKSKADPDDIEKIFGYWKRRMNHDRAQLSDDRRKVIRKALKAGYTPHDLCRAIEGCSLTPHNMGENERGEKYDSIELILRDAAHIDRFMANAKTPPKVPEKKPSGQVPGWWSDEALAKEQAALVGVSGPHPTDTRETFHARIRAAIDNGGKPPAPAAAPAPTPAAQDERVQLTDEQKAANRAALLGALKGFKPGADGVMSVASALAGGVPSASLSLPAA